MDPVQEKYNATVVSIQHLTPDLFIIKVRPDKPMPAFISGQYVLLGLSSNLPRRADCEPEFKEQKPDRMILRAYSIASCGDEPELFEFYISVVANGSLTPRMVQIQAGERLNIGDKVRGFFTLDTVPASHEWVILANLLCLLVGFAFLSRHFEESRIPAVLPRYLPDDWKGGFMLLVMVFVLSSFLDNIAAAMIGGAMAHTVFRGRVHIGYLAAIVAASNAGGSGSVVGDTTTTMMWISGVSPLSVVEAYVAAGAGFLIFAIPAALQQHRFSPIEKDAPRGLRIEWTYVGIVAAILVAAIASNIIANLRFPMLLDTVPVIGLRSGPPFS